MLLDQLMRVAAFRALGWLAFLASAAGCGSRPRAEALPSQQRVGAPIASQRAECFLCDRTPPWHEEPPSVDPDCSAMTLHDGGQSCNQVARQRIARTATVNGLSSNEALTLYEGAYRCAHCPSVSLRGTAPLEYPALVAQEDGKKVIAHVGLDLEMQFVAGAPKTRATLTLSYLDRQNAERVEKYELESK